MDFNTTAACAKTMDANDSLKDFRNEFIFPQHNDKNVLYFCGNSLGLQPKSTSKAIAQELEDWAKYGVEGHFLGHTPWFSYHEALTNGLAHIAGAKSTEVVAMNSLTVNLHLLMVSFYKPTTSRYQILIEPGAFPSDQYAVQSQAKFHGFDPQKSIVEPTSASGAEVLTTADIVASIEKHKNSLALILLGGVNYKTGQAFEVEPIVKKAREYGIVVGLDLAHAAGNLVLKLHDWDVDFAAWCGYKYLNGGPGGIAGAFVHERHAQNTSLTRFAGWWGHNKTERFKMAPQFDAIPTAEGWQLSNPPIFQLAALRSSLDLFLKADIKNLRAKSETLTAYLAYLLEQTAANKITILTPQKTGDRGCQLSVRIAKGGVREIQQKLIENGVICDIREPDIMRIAPVPLYNSFEDIFTFCQVLKELV